MYYKYNVSMKVCMLQIYMYASRQVRARFSFWLPVNQGCQMFVMLTGYPIYQLAWPQLTSPAQTASPA